MERYVQDAPLATQHLIADAVVRALRPQQSQLEFPLSETIPAIDDDVASEPDDLALHISVEDADMTGASLPSGAIIATPNVQVYEIPDNLRIVVNATSGIAHWDYIRTDQDK